MKLKIHNVLLFGATLIISSPTFAGDNSDSYLEIQKLKERLAILEKKIAEDESKKSQNDLVIKLNPTPKIQTRDGQTTFALNGRMQFDAGGVTKGKTSTNELNTSVRRIWLGALGNLDKDWSYSFLVGFENNQTSVYDAFVKYSGFKNTDILIGNFFENNGIDTTTGNLATPLMERSSGIITFRQYRRTGISINPYGNNWGLHFGAFGNDPSNNSSSAVNAANKGWGFSNRAHIDVINDKKNYESLHLGWNGTYRTLSEGNNSITGSNKTMRFNSAGDSNVLNTVLIDTGNITNVDDYYQNMAEFRYQKGSLSITSEYIKTTLNRSGNTDVNFDGGYVMASYFLGGEKYEYDPKMGIQLLPVIGSKGAWELATRYSTTNLNDGAIRGGKLNSYDFGVSYYPNNYLKLMANYIFNRTDSSAQIQKNPQYLMFRTQVSF